MRNGRSRFISIATAFSCLALNLGAGSAAANPEIEHKFSDVTIGNVKLSGITLHIEIDSARTKGNGRERFWVTCGAAWIGPDNGGETIVSLHFNLLNAAGQWIDTVYNNQVVIKKGTTLCDANNHNWVLTDEQAPVVQAQISTTQLLDFNPVNLTPSR